MKVIAKGRGTGKTKELLYEAFTKGGQVLTTNKRALQSKADAYGYVGMTILDWNDMLYGEYHPNKPLYIHKADDVFTELFTNDFELKLKGMSITTGEE